MRNIAPSSAIARRGRQFIQVAFFFMASGIFSAVVGLALKAINLVPPAAENYSTYLTITDLLLYFGILMFFIGLVLAIRGATFRPDNTYAQTVGEFLGQYLDDGYVYIRNVSKFGLGYIDAVLVGPPGALVFRIIDKHGSFLNEGDKWLKAGKNQQWEPAGFNATVECIVDIKALRNYLAKDDMPNIPVFGVVVFIADDPQTKITLKNPTIPATHMTSLMPRLEPNYFAKSRITPEQSAEIVKKLYSV